MKGQKIIYSLDTLFRIVKDAKSLGKTVGLTYGAFDLFHISHLDLLEKSSSVCDYLIVGVDSDKSIRNYKTSRRPIINARNRLKIINSMSFVDAVFIKDIASDSNAHIKLYKDLLADIITIGQGFAFEKRLENEVDKVSTQLVKIDTYQSTSTTKIIETILKRHDSSFHEVPRENNYY